MSDTLQVEFIQYKGQTYNRRHGSPFDRGSADSYYHRNRRPHYFEGASYSSKEIIPKYGTKEYMAYLAGYDYNEEYGDKKDWGEV